MNIEDGLLAYVQEEGYVEEAVKKLYILKNPDFSIEIDVKTIEQIDYKMRNFLHHLEYEKSGINVDDLKKLVDQKKIMYDHKADKTNQNKWKSTKSLNDE